MVALVDWGDRSLAGGLFLLEFGLGLVEHAALILGEKGAGLLSSCWLFRGDFRRHLRWLGRWSGDLLRHGTARHRVQVLTDVDRVGAGSEGRGELWVAVADHLRVVVLDVRFFIRGQDGIVAQGVVVGHVGRSSSASHWVTTTLVTEQLLRVTLKHHLNSTLITFSSTTLYLFNYKFVS